MNKLTEFLIKPFLNEDILEEGARDPGIFKAIFLAGGPGSGKSYVASKLFGIPEKINVSKTGLKMVNQDSELEMLLNKYFGTVDLDNITGVLLQRAIVVIPDITFHNDHFNTEFFNRKCPKFYQHFLTRYNHLKKQFAPKKLPNWM